MASCNRETIIEECVWQHETPGFKFEFTDDSNNPVTPTSLQWSLMTLGGTIINNRENIDITPASEVIVVLNTPGNENDLSLTNHEKAQGYGWRKIVMHGTYVSSNLGAGAKLESVVKFKIQVGE